MRVAVSESWQGGAWRGVAVAVAVNDYVNDYDYDYVGLAACPSLLPVLRLDDVLASRAKSGLDPEAASLT